MSSNFFCNKECQYFPCHTNLPLEKFNCLFCYCPLYLIENCGGNYHMINDKIKDCSNCTIPHNKDNYNFIIKKLQEKIFTR